MPTTGLALMHIPVCVCVCLYAPDLPEINVSHSSVLVTEGDNVTVSCNGSGAPLPEVDWTVGDLHSINTHLVRHLHVPTQSVNEHLRIHCYHLALLAGQLS